MINLARIWLLFRRCHPTPSTSVAGSSPSYGSLRRRLLDNPQLTSTVQHRRSPPRILIGHDAIMHQAAQTQLGLVQSYARHTGKASSSRGALRLTMKLTVDYWIYTTMQASFHVAQTCKGIDLHIHAPLPSRSRAWQLLGAIQHVQCHGHRSNSRSIFLRNKSPDHIERATKRAAKQAVRAIKRTAQV